MCDDFDNNPSYDTNVTSYDGGGDTTTAISTTYDGSSNLDEPDRSRNFEYPPEAKDVVLEQEPSSRKLNDVVLCEVLGDDSSGIQPTTDIDKIERIPNPGDDDGQGPSGVTANGGVKPTDNLLVDPDQSPPETSCTTECCYYTVVCCETCSIQ